MPSKKFFAEVKGQNPWHAEKRTRRTTQATKLKKKMDGTEQMRMMK